MKQMYLVFAFLISAAVSAQGTQPGTPAATTPAASQEDPHNADNYLEKQTALKGIDQARSEQQKDIRKLTVIVANYGAAVAGSDAELKKIKDLYEESSVLYYRQQYVKSRETLNQAKTQTSELYKKFDDMYAKQTDELMIQCAKAVANLETTQTPGGGNAPEWSTALILNQSRLRTAFGHVVIAQDLNREKRYDDAIDHYRLAKLFGIGLLRGLEEDPQKAKAIDDKYKIDLQDATGGKAASAPSK